MGKKELNRSEIIRCSKNFKRLINVIRAKVIIKKDVDPTSSEITKVIAEIFEEEERLNEIIQQM